MPCSKTFKNKIMPEAIQKVKNSINKKLNKASVVILIVDIWSNAQMTDFMGLAAMVAYENMEKECFAIGLQRMPGSHNEENIKITMQLIINGYDFDKSKVKRVVCDQGSSPLRLFKQLVNTAEEIGELGYDYEESEEEDNKEEKEVEEQQEQEQDEEDAMMENPNDHLNSADQYHLEKVDSELNAIVKSLTEFKVTNALELNQLTEEEEQVMILNVMNMI